MRARLTADIHSACLAYALPGRLLSLNDFGRCTAMAEAETTDHAAMASLMARAEQLLTALAHLGPPLPHLPVLSRVAPNGPPRRKFSSANSANSVKQCFPDLQQAVFECT